MKREILLILCFGMLATPSVLAQQSDTQSLISTGVGIRKAPPDHATIRLGVSRDGMNAQNAQLSVNTVMQAVLAQLSAAGISQDAVSTSRLQLLPTRDPRDRNHITGYRASHEVTIELDDFDLIALAIDRALGAGANELQGIEYSLTDDNSLRQEALADAVRAARNKADAMASAANVSIGRILEITESGGGSQPPSPVYRMAAMEGAPTPVLPGLVEVRAQVVVHYEIVEKAK
jgi:uncharacterized protein YggE